MASSTKLEAIYVTVHLPLGSIYHIVVLKVHMWCSKVLWACGMQTEYMCMCSAYIRAGAVLEGFHRFPETSQIY